MPRIDRQPPRFAPLEKVVVIEKDPPAPEIGGILGAHATVIWRMRPAREPGRSRTGGWQYVVLYWQTEIYDAVEESRLMATGEVAPLASCLGRDFEISFDCDGSRPDAVCGTFRTPGRLWDAFVFRRAAVESLSYQVRMPVSSAGGKTALYDFRVPEDVRLDCAYIEEVMSKVVHTRQWRRVRGPRSAWLM